MVRLKTILELAGYKLNQQKIQEQQNQKIFFTLEEDHDGVILKVQDFPGEIKPYRVSSNFIYFKGQSEKYRINKKQFVENALKALAQYFSFAFNEFNN
ncbi:MAG: hypothetical protein QW097_02305 [archaeon]